MPNEFVHGVEIVEGGKDEGPDKKINDGPGSSNFSLVDKIDIAGDAAR